MSGYRLELGKAGSPSSKTPPFGAASDAVRYLEMWKGSGNVVISVLRDGKSIYETILRKDAETERKKLGR